MSNITQLSPAEANSLVSAHSSTTRTTSLSDNRTVFLSLATLNTMPPQTNVTAPLSFMDTALTMASENPGALAAGISVLVVVCLIFLCCCCRRRCQRHAENKEPVESTNNTNPMRRLSTAVATHLRRYSWFDDPSEHFACIDPKAARDQTKGKPKLPEIAEVETSGSSKPLDSNV
jgi:hypothetical protein